MTRFKDFGSPITDENSGDPITFKLYGETFTALPEVQGTVLLDIVGKSASDDVAISSGVVLTFFEDVLEEESWVRFDALLHDKKRIVKMEKLGEIVGWLIEQYSSRPEEPRED